MYLGFRQEEEPGVFQMDGGRRIEHRLVILPADDLAAFGQKEMVGGQLDGSAFFRLLLVSFAARPFHICHNGRDFASLPSEHEIVAT